MLKNKVFFAILIFLFAAITSCTSSSLKKSGPVVEIKNYETGKIATIAPIQINSQDASNKNIVQYQAEISPELLSSLVSSRQGWDSSMAVLVTIWMYYDSFTIGSTTWLSVDHYATKWELYDYSVSLKNAYFNMGCQSDIYEGGSCGVSTYQQSEIFTPNANTIYNASPFWKGKHVDVSSGFQAGNSHVDIQRGTSTWSLEICIFEGSCGGG